MKPEKDVIKAFLKTHLEIDCLLSVSLILTVERRNDFL